MTCAKCGAPCQGQYCRACERDLYRSPEQRMDTDDEEGESDD